MELKPNDSVIADIFNKGAALATLESTESSANRDGERAVEIKARLIEPIQDTLNFLDNIASVNEPYLASYYVDGFKYGAEYFPTPWCVYKENNGYTTEVRAVRRQAISRSQATDVDALLVEARHTGIVNGIVISSIQKQIVEATNLFWTLNPDFFPLLNNANEIPFISPTEVTEAQASELKELSELIVPLASQLANLFPDLSETDDGSAVIVDITELRA